MSELSVKRIGERESICACVCVGEWWGMGTEDKPGGEEE